MTADLAFQIWVGICTVAVIAAQAYVQYSVERALNEEN